MGSRSPMRRNNFGEENGRSIVKYTDALTWAVQKRLNRLTFPLGCRLGWAQGTTVRWVCTLAPPGEYDWSVRVQWQCGLSSNYFDHSTYYEQRFSRAAEMRCVYQVRSSRPLQAAGWRSEESTLRWARTEWWGWSRSRASGVGCGS